MDVLKPNLFATFVYMSQPQSIVFFDSVCNFCNSTVNWILARNRKGNIKFAAIQGEVAKGLLPSSMIAELSSLVYYRKGKCLVKSRAALTIFRDMSWYGFLALPLFLVPRFLADAIYDWIARNRYAWFGKRASCRIPSAEEKNRFLD
jgi:predicted DCC family thiol-disulfide oxidoreductase YuxK